MTNVDRVAKSKNDVFNHLDEWFSCFYFNLFFFLVFFLKVEQRVPVGRSNE